MKTKVLLFTGSRTLTDKNYLDVLRHTALAIERLSAGQQAKIICRHGAALGADSLFDEAINKSQPLLLPRGIQLQTDPHPYFKGHPGGRGGYLRNKHMIELDPTPDLCLAIYAKGEENKGTSLCVSLAEQAGIEVVPVWL